MPTLGRHIVNGTKCPLFWNNGGWMNFEKAHKEAIKFRNKTRIELEMPKSCSYLFRFFPASSHFTLKSTSWSRIWGHPFLSNKGGESSEMSLNLRKAVCLLTESGERGVWGKTSGLSGSRIFLFYHCSVMPSESLPCREQAHEKRANWRERGLRETESLPATGFPTALLSYTSHCSLERFRSWSTRFSFPIVLTPLQELPTSREGFREE